MNKYNNLVLTVSLLILSVGALANAVNVHLLAQDLDAVQVQVEHLSEGAACGR